jgi:hypothetical protein
MSTNNNARIPTESLRRPFKSNLTISHPRTLISHLQQANRHAPASIFKLFFLKARARMLQATHPKAPNNQVLFPALHLGAA